MHVGHRGRRCEHHFDDALIDRHQLVVEAAEVTEELDRDAFTFSGDRLDGPDPTQDLCRPLG
jgi:hypothetical protein